MDTQRNTTGNLHAAQHAAALGYRCIPCLPGTKVPAVKWKRYQSVAPTAAEYRAWFDGTPMNVAVLTGEAVVFDCDTADIAGLVIDHCGETPTVCRTPRGGCHLWYRRPAGIVVGNHVRVKGHPIDVRAEGGLALIPPSATDAGAYGWLGDLLPAADLPVAAIDWTLEPKRPLRAIEFVDDIDVMIRRARAYIAHIEGAISGYRGHDRTMRVAGVLVQKFGLSIGQALPLFREWNEQCEPPWSERELLHKLQDAERLRLSYPTEV
jgi:hypothetical protein